MKSNYQLQLLEEMEILYSLLENSNDIQQQDEIVKVLAQLVKFVDTRQIS